MSKPLPVQEHELQPLAADVRRSYDAVRFCASGCMALHGADGDKEVLFRDLLVTALNIHARNLVEFFESRKPKSHPDDLHATDYTDQWDPQRDCGADLVYLRSAFMPGVHKRLAHITAHRVRVDADDDAVPIAEIYLSIATWMERFLGLLPPDRRRWFDRNGKPPDTSMSALLA